eukprot:3753544-Amphidinium_carterae.1
MGMLTAACVGHSWCGAHYWHFLMLISVILWGAMADADYDTYAVDFPQLHDQRLFLVEKLSLVVRLVCIEILLAAQSVLSARYGFPTREDVAAWTHSSGSGFYALDVVDEFPCICSPCTEITMEFKADRCPEFELPAHYFLGTGACLCNRPVLRGTLMRHRERRDSELPCRDA